jgi:hypothetical protein
MRHPSPMLAAGAWFSALALIVAGPLLGGGYLLLLDFPSGPRFPQLSPLPLPSSGDIGNGVPLLALLAVLREVYGLLPDKLLLLAPIILGGTGVYRLARSRLGTGSAAAIYGGTLFVVNPFVYDRFLAGHLFFLLAYSLLPWALGPTFELTSRPSMHAAVAVAVWLFALGATDVHVLGIYVLLVVVAVIFAPSRNRLGFGAAALGLGALASSYWLVPALFSAPGENIGAADLAVYASRPRGFGVIPTLLGLDGFWRDEFRSPGERHPGLYLLLVLVLGLALLGAARLLGSGTRSRFAIVLSISAAIGVILAAGSSFPPTADAFRWLVEDVPFFGVYREPQKFLALVTLAYAIFGAVGLDALLRPAGRLPGRSIARAVAPPLAVALVIAYGYTMLWGFSGQVRPARYPTSWAQAERTMDARGEGRLLVFPWHLYAVWTFSGGRIIANPAPSFFSREVLAGDEAGFRSVPPQSPDPFSRYIVEVLAHRGEVRWLGHLVAPLGVRFIAWMREADWWQYRFLRRQKDLVPVYKGERIVLFENQAWRGTVFGLEDGAAIANPSELFGSRDEREAASLLYPSPSLVSRVDGGLPLLARSLPGGRRVLPQTGRFLAMTDRCSDGWRLSAE